ncbi:hypothetical protein IQ230_18970 [Gloeocapsopsis crepidinum LEGE 06123]|uniref:Transposase n=1 Tax=Gloeocapsopsis crepidinum LEGE 06123 TaxID=588587 RepID=A0ABR9UVQ6_9CHRO|nr:hypothetical protein [Gloeocapsopsis crepidinum LEGE 06123]
MGNIAFEFANDVKENYQRLPKQKSKFSLDVRKKVVVILETLGLAW